MKLELFCICDAATEAGGKLNVLGAFDRIWARETPVVYPHCSVVVRVRFNRIEEGAHRFRVTFADDDGNLIIQPMESGIEIRFGGSEVSIPLNLILSIHQFKLPRFGDYTIDLAIDANHLGSLPLLIRQANDSAGHAPHIPPQPGYPG